MTMKENQNETSIDSRSFERETDALTFGSKERYELNDSRMEADFTELEGKNRDDCSNFKVMDDSSVDDENGMIDSPKKQGQNGLANHLIMDNVIGDFHQKESKDGVAHHLSSWDKDADSSSSDSYDMEKEQGSPERESFDSVEELADCNKSNSNSPLFTDKNVLECDPPELEVCYRETDCQFLKDICVDEGRPEKDVNAIESCSFPLPHNDIDHLESRKEPSSDLDSFTTGQCGSNEENECINLISQEKLDSVLENSFDRNTIKHSEPENAAEISEACFDGTGKAEIDSLEDSLVDSKLPIADLGYQNSHVLDGGNEVMQLPPVEVLHQEAGPESPAPSLAEAEGTGKDVQSSCLAYNRKVENGIITFNFSSPDGVVVGNNGMAGGVPEQSAVLGDAVHKDVNAENLPVPSSNEVDDSHGQSLISNEGNSDDGSATSHVQCIKSEGSCCGNAHEGFPEHKQANSDEIPIDDDDGSVQPPSAKSEVSSNGAHASEPNAPNYDEKVSEDIPVVHQLQQDMGETSFSAASMITYSGPIAYSGSLSHRSDGSTTSGKSFAFPVLQNEWNSSPVRMAKADRRDFRKHKGWRSGLLCCRF